MTKRGGGFTIVELMVTVSIMVILMTIVTVRLISTQGNARDEERSTDTITIAQGLETFYRSGSPKLGIPKGYYPGGQQVQIAAATTPPFSEFLDGVSKSSYEAPKRDSTNSFGVNPAYATAPIGSNPDGSYSDAQVRPLLATFHYLYQPLKRDNSFCANYLDCAKYNLYYISEVDNVVHVIRSKNQ
jgi:prepilin-type N-terminal cleavage/methylation domain-containing protein